MPLLFPHRFVLASFTNSFCSFTESGNTIGIDRTEKERNTVCIFNFGLFYGQLCWSLAFLFICYFLHPLRCSISDWSFSLAVVLANSFVVCLFVCYCIPCNVQFPTEVFLWQWYWPMGETITVAANTRPLCHSIHEKENRNINNALYCSRGSVWEKKE